MTHTDIYSDKELNVCLPEEYNEELANKLENFVVENRTTLETVEIHRDWEFYDENPSIKRYLQAVVRGLVKSTQLGRGDRPLEKVYIYGMVDLNEELLTKLVWVAPFELDLCFGDDEQDDNASTEEENFGLSGWDECELDSLKIGYDYRGEETGVVTLFNLVSKINSLTWLTLCGPSDEAEFDSEALSKPFFELLKNTPDLEGLHIYDFLPEKDQFCKFLGQSTELNNLALFSLTCEVEHDSYFEALANILEQQPQHPLRSFLFEGSHLDSAPLWGPHGIHYYIELNTSFCMRQMLRRSTYTGGELLKRIESYCHASTKAAVVGGVTRRAIFNPQEVKCRLEDVTLEDLEIELKEQLVRDEQFINSIREDAKTMPLTDSHHIILCKATFHIMLQLLKSTEQFAKLEKEQLVKDVGVLYGVLRETPGVWCHMVVKRDDLENLRKVSKRNRYLEGEKSRLQAEIARLSSQLNRAGYDVDYYRDRASSHGVEKFYLEDENARMRRDVASLSFQLDQARQDASYYRARSWHGLHDDLMMEKEAGAYWSYSCYKAEEDRDYWKDRCLSAEEGSYKVEEDKNYWKNRCLTAEAGLQPCDGERQVRKRAGSSSQEEPPQKRSRS